MKIRYARSAAKFLESLDRSTKQLIRAGVQGVTQKPPKAILRSCKAILTVDGVYVRVNIGWFIGTEQKESWKSFTLWISAAVGIFIRKKSEIWLQLLAQKVAQMVEILLKEDQALAFAMVRKLVLAWDPEYTKATPEEDSAMNQAVKELLSGDYALDSEIDWN